MGKGVTDSQTRVRYPEYIEDAHKEHLDLMATYRDAAIDDSPYADYTPLQDDFELAFFGSGYTVASFPSLYDMYGKFMAGLDIESLFDEIYEESTDSGVINNLVAVHASKMSDDLEQEAMPRYATGLRDINSVMSSSFAVGKAMLETQRTKNLAEFDAQLRYNMINVAVDRWREHLKWNAQVIDTYYRLVTGWMTNIISVVNQDMEIAAHDLMWPFDILDKERASIGVLQGATTSQKQTPLWKHLVSGIAGAVGTYYAGPAGGAAAAKLAGTVTGEGG